MPSSIHLSNCPPCIYPSCHSGPIILPSPFYHLVTCLLTSTQLLIHPFQTLHNLGTILLFFIQPFPHLFVHLSTHPFTHSCIYLLNPFNQPVNQPVDFEPFVYETLGYMCDRDGGEFAFLKISLTRELMVTNIWTVRWIRTVFRGR